MKTASLPYKTFAVKKDGGVWRLVSGNTFRHYYVENYKYNTGVKDGYKAIFLGQLMSNQHRWEIKHIENKTYAVREGVYNTLDQIELA